MKTIPDIDKYTNLRKEYQAFYFDGFKVTKSQDEIKVIFDFRLDNAYEFHPKMVIKPDNSSHLNGLSDEHIHELVFQIGMVELISYWKAACPSKVVIKPYQLNNEQVDFWKKLYFHGLGEFFYTNDINVSQDDFMEIIPESDKSLEKLRYQTTHHFVVPVGGGKDSAVSLQLLKDFYGTKRQLVPFVMNPREASMNTIYDAGYSKEDIFVVERTLDPVLLEMNKEGFLNGHTPFSALLAFTGLLVSAITQNKYITLSNESSANEASIPGTKINHQYSKSLEFENDFRNYVKQYVSDQFEYFSLLRPLSEFQIARIFSRYPQYFSSFRSCNAGSKENKWCGKCPKCLFTYIILSPFLDEKTLLQIFGHNLLDDKDLYQHYLELTGQSDKKPFECVGTVNEVNVSLAITIRKMDYKAVLPELLKDFKQTEMYVQYANTTTPDWILTGFEPNNLPHDVMEQFREYMLKVFCE
mgnify:CR=1 FL=1